MDRPPFVLCAALVFLGACSNTTGSEGSGGSGGADGFGGSGGSRGDLASECETEGYPCSPADMSPEARALSHQYVDAVRERLDAGGSFEEVADWLASQDDIAHVVGDSVALRFRVDGGSAQWFYDPPPGIARPVPSEPPPAAATLPPSAGLKAVVREDDDEDNIKKRALFIEPFEELIEAPTGRWIDELNELHDYERVDHLVNQSVLDEHFRNWNDYRFVWVITHGKHLPTVSPKYSALFSSRMCEEFGWLTAEIEAGRGDELTRGGTTTLRALFGFPRGFVLDSLTPAQAERLKQYEIAETPDFDGIHCGNLEMDWIFIPGYQPGDDALTDVTIKYWFYDDTWFKRQYPGGLKDAVVYQRACTSDRLPLQVASGSRGAILGWSDTINSADDDKTIDVLFDHLISKGETLQDALKEVFDANVHEHPSGDKNPTLELVSDGRGQRRIRVRENITIVDSATGSPFADEGGEIEAFEITSEDKTRVDVSVIVEGFGENSHDEFDVQFFDETDMPLSQKVEVREPVAGKTFMTVPIELDQKITFPTDVEIEARVTLPEDGASEKFGRHRVIFKVLPPGEEQWRITVPDFGTIKGPVVSAPSVVGIPVEQGVAWLLLLTQEPPAVIPSASVTILGHNGRSQDCTGQTGQFTGGVGFVYTEDMNAPGYDGGGEEVDGCPGEINIDVQTFSLEDDLNVALSGTLCKIEPDPVGEGTIATPVPFSGRIKWPRAGCGVTPPMNPLLGSYVSSENVFLCIDIYENSILGPTFEGAFCGTTGVTCDLENACPTDNDLGQCDYRGDSSMLGVRGSVQHYRIGGDWPPIQELEATCVALGGVWSSLL